MSLNVSLIHESGPLSNSKGFNFTLAFSYVRQTKKYPGSIDVNYNSQMNVLNYNSKLQLAQFNNGSISAGFDPDKANLGVSHSANGFNNSLTWATGKASDSLSLGSSLSNARTQSSFKYSKNFSGQFDSTHAFKIRTTLYAVGTNVAIGPTSEHSSFAIIRKHPQLKETSILVNDNYPLDSLGPLGLGILTPLKDNSLTLSFDDLPSSIDITDVNINIYPEYGKGYYTSVGTKASLFILGKLIDQNNEPISLMYLEIMGMDDQEVNLYFTNSKGGFEFQAAKKQDYLIKVVDFNAEPYLLQLSEEEFDEGGYLRLPPIKMIRTIN